MTGSAILKTLNGERVHVEFEASRYYPATFEDPAEGGLEEIGTVTWNGIDVSLLLCDAEYDYLWSQLLEVYDKQEPDL